MKITSLRQAEGVAPINHSSSQKTRLNGLSYGINNLERSFFRFVTMHAFDRRRDGQTHFSSLVRAGIPSIAGKIVSASVELPSKKMQRVKLARLRQCN